MIPYLNIVKSVNERSGKNHFIQFRKNDENYVFFISEDENSGLVFRFILITYLY